MTEQEFHTEKSTELSAMNFAPRGLAELGKKRLEATIEMPTELLDMVHKANRVWLARAQSEVDLASDLASKLTAARSLPDAAMAWQEWASKRMNMFAEDGRRLVAGSQRFMETGAQFFSNGGDSGSA